MNYVILAAGLGSRFAKEGEKNPKPLVEIMGQPMIGRLIKVLMSCNAEHIYIVANSRMPELVEFLEGMKAEGYPLTVRPIVSDNSYYSLSQACEGVPGRFIAMTVDAIFPVAEFRDYAEKVQQMTDDEVMMALTRFVDDESPLWAKMSSDGSEVIDYHYGGEPFDGDEIVSAGLYGLTPRAMKFVAEREGYPESLSDFQRILAAESPIKVRPFVMSKALDVDCGHDRAVAEAFLREVNGEEYAR